MDQNLFHVPDFYLKKGLSLVLKKMMASLRSLCFILSVTWILVRGNRSPHVVVPSGTTAMVGSDVVLSCTVRKDTPEPVSWAIGLTIISSGNMIDETQISPTQIGRLSIVGNNDIGEFNLSFSNVQPEDAGEYTCGYFSFKDRIAYFSPTAVLTVLLSPVCTYHPLNTKLVPGSQIEMRCQSQNNRPNTELTWFRNGEILQGTSGDLPVISRTVSRVLTEDDYDQPFTCVENLSPIAYTPHCSIIPIRQTQKLVHVVQSSETIMVGQISRLTCLTNSQSSELQFSYRWMIGSTESPTTSNLLSFGPVEANQNGTNITCLVYQNGELYGSDVLTLEVHQIHADSDLLEFDLDLPWTTSPPLSTKLDIKQVLTITSKPTIKSRPITTVIATDKKEPPYDYLDNSMMMDGYLIVFITVAATIGVLLVIAIVCLTLVLTREREMSASSSTKAGLPEESSSSFAELRETDDFDSSNSNHTNMINECIEAVATRPHYFTLESELRGTHKKKQRKVSDSALVTYSKVSKNKKSSKRTSSPTMPLANGAAGISRSRSTSAYAVTTVGKATSSKRHMSAKRPLPQRPEGEEEYKVPTRSYSESGKDATIGRSGLSQPLDQNATLTDDITFTLGSASADSVEQTNTLKAAKSDLIIDLDYSEVGESAIQRAESIREERPYEFTTVYDALQEDKVTNKGNPDSGYHDSSSMEGTEIESDGHRSGSNRSSLISSHLVKAGAEDNLYASLEDCSIQNE